MKSWMSLMGHHSNVIFGHCCIKLAPLDNSSHEIFQQGIHRQTLYWQNCIQSDQCQQKMCHICVCKLIAHMYN